ncbi:hypothetical protein QTA58_00320 [Neorhizobium sp. CSC1952]|nr:hypothetical protein [Rhizobium sp. CSC1952]WJR67253.1 hypothetical protein QTA58_00320 [Rhizobium sp. CSC1952]
MATPIRPQHSLRVQILDDNNRPSGLPITVIGRESWTLRKLIGAGERGISSLDNIGPRISHYVWKLRGYGLAIETIQERHGGEFPGIHARYKLCSKLEVLSDAKRVAA